jgi:caffeoyl-CoA O-methyltransferase
MDTPRVRPPFLLVLLCSILAVAPTASQPREGSTDLDARVRSFLESHAGDWHDMNVPESDGKLLHDLVVKNGYRRALEIGTSTGRSSIWIAWALSKTGGKLVTIEIDASRHKKALENFREAGLSDYIDARLADAHDLVRELAGPFDFVFNDADKDWYKNYFMAVSPKLMPGGCFVAHNASMRDRGIREFLEYVKGLPGFKTTIDTSSRSGVSVSCKQPAD